MSKHQFKHKGFEIEAGWDKPLQMFYMTIFLDKENKESEDVIFYCNLDDRNAGIVSRQMIWDSCRSGQILSWTKRLKNINLSAYQYTAWIPMTNSYPNKLKHHGFFLVIFIRELSIICSPTIEIKK